jgi:hypothetical protein
MEVVAEPTSSTSKPRQRVPGGGLVARPSGNAHGDCRDRSPAGSLGENDSVDLGLSGRVYLVTGGSRGLGFAAAEILIADGARVVLSGPHEATASAAAARLSHNAAAAPSVTWVLADNSDPATPDRLIAAAKERFGRLDGALISVGGTPPGTIATTPDEAWRSAFESVFLGAVRWLGSSRQISATQAES